jgi:hypothetical protein
MPRFVVIWNDQERTTGNTGARELGKDLLDPPPRRRSDIVNGNDKRALHFASVAATEPRTSRNCGAAPCRDDELEPANQLKLGCA